MLSSGDFFSRTRFAILPGSMVPTWESILNLRALLMVAARKICFERQAGLFELLRLQIAVQSGQIPVCRGRGSVRAKKKAGVFGREVANDLAHAPERAGVESFEHGCVRRIIRRNFFLEPFALGRVEPCQHVRRNDLWNCRHRQVLGIERAFSVTVLCRSRASSGMWLRMPSGLMYSR